MHAYHTNHSSRSESRGLDLTATLGTSVQASATVNVKGTWTALGAATGFTYELLCVNVMGENTFDHVLDIGIQVGGNTWVIAADLRLPNRSGAFEHGLVIPLPLHVPAGSTLFARVASSTGSGRLYMYVQGFSSNAMGMPGFSRCIALYAPASSRGVTIDAGAVINTRVRTQIIASSASRVCAIFAMVGQNADITRVVAASMALDIETGAAAAERVLIPNMFLSWGPTKDYPEPVVSPIFSCDVATAQRFSANAQCSILTAGDRVIDLALFGFVP